MAPPRGRSSDRSPIGGVFIFNLMTMPLGVYAPEVPNLPQLGVWSWDVDEFRYLLEVCISGLVADDERWWERLKQILVDGAPSSARENSVSAGTSSASAG